MSSTPIVVVPTSAGVPTVPTAAHVSVPAPTAPTAVSHSATGREERPAAPPPAAELQEGRVDGIVAGSMRSVDVLRPVEALQIRPARE
jgi:hypothetical protein